MLKSFAVVVALTSVALAQSNSSSTLIPEGISSKCSDFLTQLNNDAQLSTCSGALTTALSAFAPGSTATPSASAITSALGNVCSDSLTSSCPKNLIQSKLADFYTACTAELTSSPNAQVASLYEVLYTITPLKNAVCSKDDSANFCLLSANLPSGANAESLQKSLYTQSNQVIVPDTNSFSSNNIPFLFLSADLPSETLCTTCTRNILMAYIDFEGEISHARGLANSQLLNKQTDLYTAVTSKCGATFMDSEVKAAGGIKSGPLGASSGAAPAAEFKTLMAAAAGLMTLAVTIL